MNRDRLAVLGCGLGAAMLLADQKPEESILFVLIYVVALWSVRELTEKRLPTAFLFAPIVPWAIQLAWQISHERYSLVHPALLAFSGVVLTSALVASVLAAQPKIGWGLAGISAGGLAVSAGAESWNERIYGLPQLGHDAALSAHTTLDLVRSAGSMGRALVPVCWIALALAPFAIAELRSRKLALFGAIGAGMCRALLPSLGQEHGNDFAPYAVALYSVGWLFTLLGIVGVARSNKAGLVWAGFALAIVQIALCPTIAGTVHASHIDIVVAMSMAFGALGLALVAFSRDLPLRRFRLVAGIAFASSALGSCFTDAGVALELKGDPARWWTADLARWGTDWGFLLWCGILALSAFPPKDQMRSSTMASP